MTGRSELPAGARAWLGEAAAGSAAAGAPALPWVSLGRWPTPVSPLSLDGEALWIKREDLSHPGYGGNKLRTLEVLLGDAAARGVTRVWASGAYGSNHAVATLMHAKTAGLRAGALLFPQPYSETAAANLRASLALGPVVPVLSVATLPVAMLRGWQRDRRAGERPWMMAPGGASPLGALGALSAVFELAEQVRAQLVPAPRSIVVAAGSTCTSAGLLAGLALAQRLGAWPWPRPLLRAVRVTPWPVTSHYRVSALALRAAELALRLRAASGGGAVRGSGISRSELAAQLVIDGGQLGRGYGHATAAGEAAAARFAAAGGPELDSVYSAKAAAALRAAMAQERRGVGGESGAPMVLWSTKSAALPAGTAGAAGSELAAPFASWLSRRG